MQPGDEEYQSALAKLTQLNTTLEQSDKAWVEFLCEDLPKFDGNTLKTFIGTISTGTNVLLVLRERQQILNGIYYECYDQTGKARIANVNIAARALAESLKICDINIEAERIYRYISNPDVAKALMDYLPSYDLNNFSFFAYLLNVKTLVHTDAKKIGNYDWVPSNHWPVEPERSDAPAIVNRPDSKGQSTDGLTETVATVPSTSAVTRAADTTVGADNGNIGNTFS